MLILSDTHGRINGAVGLIERLESVTEVVHLGDFVSDADDLAAVFPHIAMRRIRGNNDFVLGVPDCQIFAFGTHRIYATHGHLYGVKRSLDKLAAKGKQEGANVVLFGHTHARCDVQMGGVRLLNPSASGAILIEQTGVSFLRF